MHQRVCLNTTLGDIELELDTEKAPKTVENFLAYVNGGHYNNTLFHRVINGFMIQGGGFPADGSMSLKPTQAPIQNEANNGLKNEAYTIAMARTNDPHSATAQFFINVDDNSYLNHSAPTPQGWGYAVFGKVITGQSVVDAIKAVKTGNKGFHQDVPVEPVVINHAFAYPVAEDLSDVKDAKPHQGITVDTDAAGNVPKVTNPRTGESSEAIATSDERRMEIVSIPDEHLQVRLTTTDGGQTFKVNWAECAAQNEAGVLVLLTGIQRGHLDQLGLARVMTALAQIGIALPSDWPSMPIEDVLVKRVALVEVAQVLEDPAEQ